MHYSLVHHLLERTVDRSPDKIAVKHQERTLSFYELFLESKKMGQLLCELGIKTEERVGILLDKSIEQIISFFGISHCNGVSVFINTILKKEQIEYIINDCDIKLLITTEKNLKNSKVEFTGKMLLMDHPGIINPKDKNSFYSRNSIRTKGKHVEIKLQVFFQVIIFHGWLKVRSKGA